jgi:hypothetical protein
MAINLVRLTVIAALVGAISLSAGILVARAGDATTYFCENGMRIYQPKENKLVIRWRGHVTGELKIAFLRLQVDPDTHHGHMTVQAMDGASFDDGKCPQGQDKKIKRKP